MLLVHVANAFCIHNGHRLIVLLHGQVDVEGSIALWVFVSLASSPPMSLYGGLLAAAHSKGSILKEISMLNV